VAHKRKVALVRLNYRWRFEIVLVEPVNHLIKSSDVVVVGGKIDVATFFAVAIRIKCIRPAVFVIGEQAKVLRPVA
jgi:hypothetical protein